jgi:hypothetical protein
MIFDVQQGHSCLAQASLLTMQKGVSGMLSGEYAGHMTDTNITAKSKGRMSNSPD